ncbi:unnamed protein product [Heterosigma akashiwo]
MVEPFKLFDNNGSGLMNVIALEHIIKNLGDVLTDEEYDEMSWLKEWLHSPENKDVDGNIEYAKLVEFLQEMMVKV